MKEGFVVWLTGLPGSGKTTIARELEPELKKRGWCVEVLDGDEIRQNLSKGPSSAENTEKHTSNASHTSPSCSQELVSP